MKSESKWDQPLISVDVVPVVFDATKRTLSIALGRRQYEPNKGEFALPGVLLLSGERASDAAVRALEAKLGVNADSVRLIRDIGVSDNPERDPRGPSLSIVYLAVLDNVKETDDLVLHDIKKISEDTLPFDHNSISKRAIETLSSLILTDKVATKAVVGQVFRTTELFSVISELYLATGGLGVAPDRSNLSRRLRGTEWFSRVEPTHPESSSISSSTSKGRPSTPWVFID